MLIDDFTGGFVSRREAREFVDEMIAQPLISIEQSDIERLREYEEQLRDTWGESAEAIASQNDPMWGGDSWRL